MAKRYRADDLVEFASGLFRAAGMAPDKALTTSRLLVEADLMGHTTHGLALAPGYLAHLRSGKMEADGAPTVISDTGSAACWDGKRLPGLWLTSEAVEAAISKARQHGTGTVAVRRSHHIGCLAVFLRAATEQGMMLILASSDPAVRTVAPFGGSKALFTPNPIAVGIPTNDGPMLVDISASVTTNGYSARLAAEGRQGDHVWWLDSEGNPTKDSGVVEADPPGTILPMGGLDHGHKGYGLALVIEALTQGLSGYGRAEAPTDWGASVFVQALDPRAFGGLDPFARETGWLADNCRRNPPRPGMDAVRVPGDAALARRLKALAEGVELYPAIMPKLVTEAERSGLQPPEPVS